MKLPVIIEKDQDGFYVADCPDLPGCHTQGTTAKEAMTNIKDAIKLHLETFPQEDRVLHKNRSKVTIIDVPFNANVNSG